MTEVSMMTLTHQLREKSNKKEKKRASQPSPFQEPEDFLPKTSRQGEITMILEEIENLKLQYLSKIHTTTSQENNSLDSDI